MISFLIHKVRRAVGAASFTGLLLSFWVQPAAAADTTAVQINYDPIVAALDSMVSQCYIQRLCSPNPMISCFGEKEVPAYADDIYRKRIEKIQSPIPLTFNDEVKQYINLYGLQKRALTERVMGLAQLYFPLYEQILDQQQLPLEFKYLSVVESALNPTAVSPVGASGLWQFMLATGKMYGLQVTSYTDDRRDPVKSTYAACQYFKDMYAIYNDWLLVIASYNCGPGNVNRAIARSGGKRTFWEISPYLPRETRGYVPAFIAVTYLMNYTAEHNLTAVEPLVNYFEVDTVMVNHRIDLHQAAAAINVPYEVLSYLNPVYKRGIIPESETAYVLRMPTNRMNQYLANEATLIQPPIETLQQPETAETGTYVNEQVRKTHRVKKGEHLLVIANKYNCSVNDLKRWNNLRSTRLQTGQQLKVYVNVPKKVEPLAVASKPKETVASISTSDTLATTTPDSSAQTVSVAAVMTINTNRIQDPGTMYHVVAPGDTLWKIAQRYEGLTVEKIKEINQLESNELKIGTRLKVGTGG